MWIILTLLAAFSQALRNLQQKMLSNHLNALGTTFGRYFWSVPLALIYILGFEAVNPVGIPNLNLRFWLSAFGAGTTQIVATIFLVLLFKRRNYMVGAGLTKSEGLMAAIFGVLFFGASISILGWIGIAVGALAIWILQGIKGVANVDVVSLALGLGAGTLFAFTTLFVRDASLQLAIPFMQSATWVLFVVVSIQTALLLIWMLIFELTTLKQMLKHKMLVFRTSLAGSLASLFWFAALSLAEAGLVKTLGQVEMVFAMLLSHHLIKERVNRREFVGLFLIILSSILVII